MTRSFSQLPPPAGIVGFFVPERNERGHLRRGFGLGASFATARQRHRDQYLANHTPCRNANSDKANVIIPFVAGLHANQHGDDRCDRRRANSDNRWGLA